MKKPNITTFNRLSGLTKITLSLVSKIIIIFIVFFKGYLNKREKTVDTTATAVEATLQMKTEQKTAFKICLQSESGWTILDNWAMKENLI